MILIIFELKRGTLDNMLYKNLMLRGAKNAPWIISPPENSQRMAGYHKIS